MNPNMLCSRCKKRMAVIFMTRIENGQTISEGLCLRCAKELGLKPVDDIMKKLGINEEDIDDINEQMMETLSSDSLFQQGGAQPFPFIQNPVTSEQSPNAAIDAEITPLDPVRGGAQRQQTAEPSRDSSRRQQFKYLSNFCENLCDKAREGRMDTIIGRDEEIYRVVQILNRRTKNNPCLIGEPGVGKTAIAEGIAQRIVAREVPEKLADKEIYMLDLTGLVAGTQFRGQFESRVKGLLADVKKAGNVILFIDEVHTLVGVGDSEGSMNAANILKPALSRGEIQVIGATTFTEYRKNIEKDAALERRFQPVKVAEPTIEQTIQMLSGIKKYYEAYHRVKVSDYITARAVVLSERYINDRFLPDKAIDLLDEACSCASLASAELAEFDRLVKEKLAVHSAIEELEKSEEPDFEAAAALKSDMARLEQRLDEISDKANNIKVSEDDLAKVIELWTGIPASRIKETEVRRVAELEQNLKKHIIGQDEAVDTVAAAVRRSRIRLTKKKRPASFIFVGPTGVGKTELVKVLAEELFDNVEPLIRLDMSEFMEKFSVSRIIGSPPGYVGYDEAGQLTEKVRRRPYSIVLLDEIEKAHPDVMNILLQILDEGRINDAQGRTVSFENTIIIMTSNAGSERRESSIGFTRDSYDIARDKALKALSDFLRPEFIARIDEVVVFRPLSREDYAAIAELMLGELRDALVERAVKLKWDGAVTAAIAEKSFGKKSGARDIRHTIRREIEDAICLMIAGSAEEPPENMTLAADEQGKISIITA